MAPPLDAVPTSIRGTRVVHGRLVGLEAQAGGKLRIRLKPEDSPRMWVGATDAVANQAAQLFNRGVRAKVMCEWNERGEPYPIRIESLEGWSGSGRDLFNVLTEVGQRLTEEGVKVSLENFERNLWGEAD